jgi:chromosome partitioning protein
MAARKTNTTSIEAPPQKVVIVCTSPKGGVGKGTVVQAIAVAAAMEGRSVALLDYDPQRSSLKWLNRRAAVEEVAPISGKGGTWTSVREELAEAAASYDVVCIDTPTAVEDHIVEVDIILRAADYVLIPTGSQYTDRESTKPWMTVIRGRTQRAAFVLNRVNRQTRSLREAKMDLLGVGKLCPVEIPLYEDIHLQQEPGFSVVEIADAKGYAELLAVWNYLKAEMGMH